MAARWCRPCCGKPPFPGKMAWEERTAAVLLPNRFTEAGAMKIKVIIHEAEEGGYWATVPALPGCVSEGDTWEEMLANIREAIECYLDVGNPPLPEKARV